MNVESTPHEYSASQVVRHSGERFYKCNECKALLLDGEDARAHLWWHDTVVTVKP